ncbi:MAG: hypothetical protein CL910_06915 [Deltaproteobacteria bacterium]|nr:hypothetical protein [Deltaproteobacteria bacterium]
MSRRSRTPQPWWVQLAQGELLDTRICDLGLQIEGTALETRVQRLWSELREAGFKRLRPYVWLSTDWFTPDGLTGFAIPFFLAHPRLARLEARHMLEVEGGEHEWCMKLLRHEAAHAVDNAYRLRRRKRWREVFGRPSKRYSSEYVPRPLSREFVLNLDYWYSQSHPLEDWAETFSVWLQPRSQWRMRYDGWPAMKKLEFVDELVAEIGDAPPKVRTRSRPDSLSKLRLTLREYYRQKQAVYADDHTTEYDEPLQRIFSGDPMFAHRERATRFLIRHYNGLRNRVASITGQHPYLIKQVFNELLRRCGSLNLRLTRPPAESRVDVAVLLTTLTMTFLYGGHSEYRR